LPNLGTHDDGGNEFSSGIRSSGQSLQFDWEILLPNFVVQTPQCLSLPVQVERIFLSPDNTTLIGHVAVANLAFEKVVVARYTLDYWKTTSDVMAEFNHDVDHAGPVGYDRFSLNLKLTDQTNLEDKAMYLCFKYCVNDQEYWDNNNAANFQVNFRKKHKSRDCEKRTPSAANQPLLPECSRKPPPKLMTKLKHYYRGLPDSFEYNRGFHGANHGHAFTDRYSFETSLAAAVEISTTAVRNRVGIAMDLSQKCTWIARAMVEGSSPSSDAQAQLAETELEHSTLVIEPRTTPQQSNELLRKYCFVCIRLR
jgi:hypothetical protein